MDMATVKQYLRVDGDDEDDLIQIFMDAAEEYIVNAVGKFDETKARAKQLYLAVVQDLYDNRQLVAVSPTGRSASQYFRHMVQSIVGQLLIEELLESEGNDGV